MKTKIVAHYKESPMAYVPEVLVKCHNRYGDKYNSLLLSPNENTFSFADKTQIHVRIPVCININEAVYDVIHFHNKSIPTDKKKIISYHSLGHYCNLDFDGKKTVEAQYQASLPYYKGLDLIKNIIDFYDPEYDIQTISDKIKIGYSPSAKSSGKHAESKGYPETMAVLNKIKEKNPAVELDIITDVPLIECIKRKSECNILIDECVTTSFHRSGLEGLALGKMTICSLGPDVIETMKRASGSVVTPFENVWVEGLENFLQTTINNGIEAILSKGNANRKWMESYWNPKDIILGLENIYENL